MRMDNRETSKHSLQETPEKQHGGAKKRLWLWILLAILAVAAIATAVILACAEQDTNQDTPDVNVQEQEEQDIPLYESAEPVEEIDYNELLMSYADPDFMQGKLNILLLGTDRNQKRVEQGMNFRTDVIVLVTVDFNANDIKMLSIPRDTLAWISSTGRRNRVNAAFSTGGSYTERGYEYTLKTVSNLLGGLPIDYYMCVDMVVVQKLVDAMGGVYYDVDIDVDYGNVQFGPGYQKLTGKQALTYCRMRKGSSDIARVDRQQRMLIAVLKQMKEQNLLAFLPKALVALSSNIDTNLDLIKIASLASFALRLDDIEGSITRETLPGDFMDLDNAIGLWAVNEYKKRDLIQEWYGVEIVIDKTNTSSYLKPLAEKKAALRMKGKTAIQEGNRYLATGRCAELSAEYTSARAAVQKILDATELTYIERGIQDMEAALSTLESVVARMKALLEAADASPSPSPSEENPTASPQPSAPTESPDPVEPSPPPAPTEESGE